MHMYSILQSGRGGGGVGVGVGVGEGYSKTFYTWLLCPKVQPLILLHVVHVPVYTILTERYPFHIASIDKWYPFQIPSLELCTPFNRKNAMSFKPEHFLTNRN